MVAAGPAVRRPKGEVDAMARGRGTHHRGTPALGNLLDPDLYRRNEQDALFTRLRAESPVSWSDHPRGRGFWSVVTHADLVAVNRDAQLFSSEVGSISLIGPDEQRNGSLGADTRGAMMIATDPPRHTRYRRLVSGGFTPRTLKLLEDSLRLRATRIVDAVIEQGECDFVEAIASELPLQAIADIMGVPQHDRRRLFDWSNRMVGLDDPEYASADGTAAAAELYAYVNRLAEARRKEPADDIITQLVNAEVDGDSLSEVEFDLFMVLLTLAGNETTRNSTSWGMWALIDHPDQYAYLGDHPEAVATAVEEILRWASPVLHFRRTATRDTELHGQPIAAGDKVVMWHVSANRDEEVFDDPFTFDVTRTPNDHVSFGGGGPHHCLGAYLARLQLRLIFAELTGRITDMTLAGPPELLRSNVLRGIKRMPVRFTPGPRVGTGAGLGPSAEPHA
jgi:cholest-4-en-3-one 26-monooxygenase